MWLEMSRDAQHGGPGWGFGECLWSPSRKKLLKPSPKLSGGGTWPFWELLLKVKEGDFVFHLRGKNKKAEFVGYSTADADGYETKNRPPITEPYSYSSSFYVVPLTGWVCFPDPVPLAKVFAERGPEVRQYLRNNKLRKESEREHLFAVEQAKRLQCLNGAYLSELSNDLAGILFGVAMGGPASMAKSVAVSTRTGEQLAQVKARLGQSGFSGLVRANYGNQCCFPSCPVAEDTLLVGAHIARWSDAPLLRGQTSNGLCLCLFHDKAFEKGYFTLTKELRVATNPKKVAMSPWGKQHLVPFEGTPLRAGLVPPTVESLENHWERIKFVP